MSKYLEVEHNKVILNPHRPGKIFSLVCTVLYLMTVAGSIYVAVTLIANGLFPLPPLASLVFWTAVWAFLMRDYNCRIVFDGDAQKVYRRTILGYKELLDFADIGGITTISQTSQGCDAGTYYAVTSKGDRYGKGIRISADMYDKELNVFDKDDLPHLFQLLESHAAVETVRGKPAALQPDASALPENMVYFRRDGDCFTRRNLYRHIFFTALFVTMLGLAAASPKNGGPVVIIAAVIALLSFLAPVKLVLDAGERVVRLVWGWGLMKSAYPFDNFLHFNSARQSINFIPVGTHFSMVMEDPKRPGRQKKLQIGYGYSTKRFSRMAEEIWTVMGRSADDEEADVENNG